jgi:uncharacterized protein
MPNIIEAARRGDLTAVQDFILNGSDVNSVNKVPRGRDETALGVASRGGYTEIVSYLLKNGADVTCPCYNFNTALAEAAEGGHIDVARILIEHGVLANEFLNHAAMLGYAEIVRLLIEHGAEVTGTTLISAASGRPVGNAAHLEIVRELLAHGADIHMLTNSGRNALMVAAESGNVDIVRLLHAAGCDINAQNNNGETALLAKVSSGHPHIAMITTLLELGADPEIRDDYNNTALLAASRKGEEDRILPLIEHGADVNAHGEDGDTALTLAAYRSAYRYTPEVIPSLLAHGAYINDRNTDGNTALMNAASRPRNLECLNILLEYGADVSLGNNDGLTALEIATRSSRTDAVETLEHHQQLLTHLPIFIQAKFVDEVAIELTDSYAFKEYQSINKAALKSACTTFGIANVDQAFAKVEAYIGKHYLTLTRVCKNVDDGSNLSKIPEDMMVEISSFLGKHSLTEVDNSALEVATDLAIANEIAPLGEIADQNEAV